MKVPDDKKQNHLATAFLARKQRWTKIKPKKTIKTSVSYHSIYYVKS